MIKLNIAIICDPINDLGGAIISTLRFSKKLSSRGHKVIILAATSARSKPVDKIGQIKIYRFRSVPTFMGGKEQRYALTNSKRIEAILKKEKIEIVHFMLPTPLANSAIAAAKKLDLPIVGHSHTQPEFTLVHLPKLLNPVKEPLSNFIYRLMMKTYNKANVIICPSVFSQRILRSKGLRSKTFVISNGVDLSTFRVNKDRIISANHRHKPFKLLFVGRLEPEKNVSVLIKAVRILEKKFDNFELLIVGGGSQKKQLMNLSSKLGIEQKVKFFGRVSDNDLMNCYNSCDVFILPSLIELEGMVVLEVMAYGKPILIANSPKSASPFFVKGNGFLFNPNNPEDLATKALKLLSNTSLRTKMGRASMRHIHEYDIEKSISKLEKVYLFVVKKRV